MKEKLIYQRVYKILCFIEVDGNISIMKLINFFINEIVLYSTNELVLNHHY